MMVGLLGAFSAMSLVPRRNLGWFTTMGTATMVIYLFHGFVIKTFMALGWPEFTASYPMLGLVLTVVGAVGLTFFLAARPCGGCSSRSPTRSAGWRRAAAGPARPPRRSDRGARHDVEVGGLEAGRCVPAEVRGVPRRVLVGPRPVVRQLLELLELLGEHGARAGASTR